MRKNSKNIEKDKIIEIIKIKLILEKIINKKGEKMSKKKIIKEQKKKEEIIDKNKIENSEIQEDKKITIQAINNNKLNRYEKRKKFRNLENISITYGDKEKGKFKNFQELYTLITNTIEKKIKSIFTQIRTICFIFSMITLSLLKGLKLKTILILYMGHWRRNLRN